MVTAGDLEKFYIGCMNCDKTKQECPMALKDFKMGYIPRGFHYDSSNIDILVVGKNPGGLLQGEEKLYIGKKGKMFFDTHKKLHEGYYDDFLFGQQNSYNQRSTVFHRNLIRYIKYFLDIETDNSIYKFIALTNLFKCSTKDEQQKLNFRDILPCYREFFLDELYLFKPKVVLALGREVENFLINKFRKKEIYEKLGYNLPIVYVKHPSYYYKKDEEEDILLEIKNKIHSYL
jgi:uracil-DNA glycosylase